MIPSGTPIGCKNFHWHTNFLEQFRFCNKIFFENAKHLTDIVKIFASLQNLFDFAKILAKFCIYLFKKLLAGLTKLT